MNERRFLLVEDDQDHAELISDVLCESNGNGDGIKTEVILMKDGKEAIDFFQSGMQSQISLVILDLNLPKVDGMDVLKFIKGNSKYSSVPVIILSTSSSQNTIEQAYKNGANGYFTKPDSYEELVVKVQILKKCS